MLVCFTVIVVQAYNMCFPHTWEEISCYEQNILPPPTIAEIPATLKIYSQRVLGVPKTHFSCIHWYPWPPYSSSFIFAIGVMSAVLDFPGGSDSEESACNAGDLGLIPGSGRSPGERKG